jgi:hypothetical protein
MYSSRPPSFSLGKKRNKKKKLQFSIVDFVILMRKREKRKKNALNFSLDFVKNTNNSYRVSIIISFSHAVYRINVRKSIMVVAIDNNVSNNNIIIILKCFQLNAIGRILIEIKNKHNFRFLNIVS